MKDEPGDLIQLKDRALSATAEGITIADARLDGQPIIYANAAFERLTGYAPDFVLGRNCRFLQGPDTDGRTREAIRHAVRRAEPCNVEILNYRRDGTPFWNRLSITPVRDERGEVTHFIGVQSDVTARRRAEDALRATRDELQRALREIERDIELAARVQRAALPRETPAIEGFRAAWQFLPCAGLAGDFLGVLPLDDRRVGLYVLDVSGHGASAALLAVSLGRLMSAVSRPLVPVRSRPRHSRQVRPHGAGPRGPLPESEQPDGHRRHPVLHPGLRDPRRAVPGVPLRRGRPRGASRRAPRRRARPARQQRPADRALRRRDLRGAASGPRGRGPALPPHRRSDRGVLAGGRGVRRRASGRGAGPGPPRDARPLGTRPARRPADLAGGRASADDVSVLGVELGENG